VSFSSVGLLSTNGTIMIGIASGTLPEALNVALNGEQPGGGGALRRLPPAGAGWRQRRGARDPIPGLAGGSAARLAYCHILRICM
jgi:hypothetical protein